jgi:hypothetical protein
VRALVRDFEEQLRDVRTTRAEDLGRSAAHQTSVISRALREMRDLDPGSALGSAVARIEEQLSALTGAVAASQATAAERRRGAAKGADYETLVAMQVAAIAAVFGDVAEQTGARPRVMLAEKARAKRGDITVTVSASVRIVVEAMDRQASELSQATVVAELRAALANRNAQAAIAVLAGAGTALMCGQPLQLLGPELWAVVLERDAPDPLALQVAYRLARAHVTAPSALTAATDLRALRRLAESGPSARREGIDDSATSGGIGWHSPATLHAFTSAPCTPSLPRHSRQQRAAARPLASSPPIPQPQSSPAL